MGDNPAKVIELPRLPLHAVTDGGASRGRGRPPKVDSRPGRDDLEYHAHALAQQALVVGNDELVRAASKRSQPREVLRIVIETLAADAATLAHVRDEFGRRGRQGEVAQITSRRAAILDKIASLTVEVANSGVEILDLHSEQVQRTFGMFVDEVSASAREVLGAHPALLDVFFNTLARRFEGWEERAEACLR